MKVAIITEGKSGTGYGHLTRCLSLYQAFEEKNIKPLYIANCDENGKKFTGLQNLIQLDWLNEPDLLYNILNDFDIAIIDSYLAHPRYYKKIQEQVKKTVYIDDYIRLDYPPGIIVNGTVGAEKFAYKKDDQHQYLLGIDYIPLRKEFWDIETKKGDNSIDDVLIIFGAQDPRNLTFPTLNKLMDNFSLLNYHVVACANNMSGENNNFRNVNFYYSLTAKEMVELMQKCNLAITASGQTTYELARIGLLFIAIGVIENQKYNLKGWVEKGLLDSELWYYQTNLLEVLTEKVNKVVFGSAFNSEQVCDGQGARKIIKKILDEDTFFNQQPQMY